MRRIIISFCILFSVLSLKAQSVNGIRIDGGNVPILVYLGGTRVCLPATACFIANLNPGYYTVEVFATRFTSPGERIWKGEKLYSERIYFNGNGVKDIVVGGSGDSIRPGKPGGQGAHRPDYNRRGKVMNEQLFKAFYDNMKKEPFKDERMALLNAVLAGSDFTSDQCLRLTKLYTFDDDRMEIMKMMYPRIVDKEAFFTVVSTLTFSSNKDEMYKFVRNYSRR